MASHSPTFTRPAIRHASKTRLKNRDIISEQEEVLAEHRLITPSEITAGIAQLLKIDQSHNIKEKKPFTSESELNKGLLCIK